MFQTHRYNSKNCALYMYNKISIILNNRTLFLLKCLPICKYLEHKSRLTKFFNPSFINEPAFLKGGNTDFHSH